MIAASAGLLLLASLPYAAGYLAQTPQLVFSGAVFDRMDYAHHLGGIWMGVRGEWRFHLLNTSDPHPAGYVKEFYLALGQLARLLNLTPVVAFHLARLGAGVAALITVYRVAALCFQSIALRRTMLLFFGLGSGLGWAQLLLGWLPQADISPVDFWHIDGYGFFGLLTFPHITAAYCLVTVATVAGARFLKEPRLRRLILPGGAIVALQLIQPFTPAIVYAALIGYAILGWIAQRRFDFRQASALAVVGLVQVPLLAYQVWFLTSHPVWRSFLDQNVTLSPPPLYYLLGYGLLAPLAVWGAALAIRRERGLIPRLAIAWAVTTFILAYLSLQLQRRFTEAVMVPISLLATLGLGYGFLPWMGRRARRIELPRAGDGWRRARRLLLTLSVFAASLSSIYLSLGGTLLAAARPASLFDPSTVVAGVDWLGAHNDWRLPVFSAERTGSLIVGRIGHTVYLGHVVETAFHDERAASVTAFFRPDTSDATRRETLRACGCRYVFFGPFERELGAWDPSPADYLQPVFRQGDVMILRFSP